MIIIHKHKIDIFDNCEVVTYHGTPSVLPPPFVHQKLDLSWSFIDIKSNEFDSLCTHNNDIDYDNDTYRLSQAAGGLCAHSPRSRVQ